MLQHPDKKADFVSQFPIPPKLKRAYQAFKLVAETSTYKIIEADAGDSKEKHRIRVLDRSKEFVNKKYDLTATLFVKELLHLQSRYPGSILTNTFEISDDGQQIACATLPYLPLSCQLNEESVETFNPKDSKSVQKLISDALYDIEFLWKNMQIRKIMDVLGPESLCFMKEKDAFFLSDWSKLFENGAADLLMSDAPITTTIPSLQGQKLTSQELAGEIKALALSVLKLNKIDFSKIESLRQVKGIDSGEFASEVERTLSKSFNEEKKGLQQLIEKMLTLESQNLPNLGDLRIEDAKSQAPINEESKQINDIEAQHPSRPNSEEVAQIQHEGQEAISSSKSSVITGKLFIHI